MNSLADLKLKCNKCKKEWIPTMHDVNDRKGDFYKSCGSCRDKLKESYLENRPTILYNKMIQRIKKKKLEDEKQ